MPGDNTTLATSGDQQQQQPTDQQQQQQQPTDQQKPTDQQQQQQPKPEPTEAEKAEEARRAALTPEQRKAEDDAKTQAEEKRKANFGAPEKYEFKTPEGRTADPEITGKLEALAREFDLSPAAAQRVYDLGQELTDRTVANVQAQVEKTRAEWETQSRADKELAGEDGKSLDANLAIGRKAMELGTPELRTLLNDTGLGNHPEIVRWMIRVGKAIKVDEHVPGSRGSITAGDARSYFPNSNMNP